MSQKENPFYKALEGRFCRENGLEGYIIKHTVKFNKTPINQFCSFPKFISGYQIPSLPSSPFFRQSILLQSALQSLRSSLQTPKFLLFLLQSNSTLSVPSIVHLHIWNPVNLIMHFYSKKASNKQNLQSTFFNIFIDYAITVVPFPPPLHSILPTPLPPTFPPYSSCP